jgi:acyl-CoA thioesterase
MAAGEQDAYDAFGKYIGVEMLGVQQGRAQARLRIQQQHLNRHGILHGAVLFALADLVLAAASNSYGPAAVAIQATISYLKAISNGVVFAEAEELSRNAVLGCYAIRISSDAGDLLAVFQGMVYFKKRQPDVHDV